MKKILFPLLILLLITSCAEENEDLVNPPSISNTINIRFINLGGTFESRTFEMLNNTMIENIPYGYSSLAVNPPADSTTFRVLQNTNLEYEFNNIYRFRIRNVNYTFLALPSYDNTQNYENVDTLLNFRTALTVPQNTDNCLVRFFNAFPDSLATYSLRLGCPNGQVVSPFMRYSSVMAQGTQVKSGEVAFSLVKAKGGQTEIIDLYGSDLEPQGQYTFVLIKDETGKEKMMLLDENSLESDAFREATVIEERAANIRTINFAGTDIDVQKITGELITANLPDNYIDLFNSTQTCASETPDSLIVSSNFGRDTIITSLEVLENYSIVAFRSSQGVTAALVNPLPNTLQDDGKATIRIVHGAESLEGLTVSLGARNNPLSKTTNTNFTIGELIATQLKYGEVSDQIYLEPSIVNNGFEIPLTIFTSTEPANLVYASLVNIEPNKSYIVVFNEDNFGNPQAFLIEDDEENSQPQKLEQGAMIQVLNAVPGLDGMNLSLSGNYLNDAKLDFSGSIATVIPPGNQTLNINGVDFSLIIDPNLRPLVIASGNSQNIEIFAINNTPMGAVFGEYKRNFINASEDIPKLGIKEEKNDSIPAPIVVDYKYPSGVQTMIIKSKQAFYFENYASGEEIYTIGDINPSFGKNYFYIFAGKKDVGDGYTVIIMQEF